VASGRRPRRGKSVLADANRAPVALHRCTGMRRPVGRTRCSVHKA
jgi:hypothetical protein